MVEMTAHLISQHLKRFPSPYRKNATSMYSCRYYLLFFTFWSSLTWGIQPPFNSHRGPRIAHVTSTRQRTTRTDWCHDLCGDTHELLKEKDESGENIVDQELSSDRNNPGVRREAEFLVSQKDATEGNGPAITAASTIAKEMYQLLGVKSVGVDYGLVRTGVATTVGYNPKPLEIISDLNNTEVCLRVVEICRSEKARQVIVGLPLHKNGTEAEQTNITRLFANELAPMVMREMGPDCPVYLWDERYTSKEAAARVHSKHPGQSLYGLLDAEAACIILENFYNDNGEGAERVNVSEGALLKCQELWKQRKKMEEEAIMASQRARDSRLNWRKEAMARDRKQEAQQSSENDVSRTFQNKKKKKRKRR